MNVFQFDHSMKRQRDRSRFLSTSVHLKGREREGCAESCYHPIIGGHGNGVEIALEKILPVVETF